MSPQEAQYVRAELDTLIDALRSADGGRARAAAERIAERRGFDLSGAPASAGLTLVALLLVRDLMGPPFP